ncbi:MAG: nucleoside triphosphate pyrophosphatase [Ectobacillus sp.]
MKRLILASGSPRRKELLEQMQIPFEIVVSQIEEILDETLPPSEVVMSLALQKANDVAKHYTDAVVLGADTIVTYQSRILGKPGSAQEALETLRLLSGKTHEVYTGVAIVSKEKTIMFFDRTEVAFYELAEEEIMSYVATNEPLDKAGSYGIQGMGAMLVREIHGDYYSVVGLPIARVVRELRNFKG